MIHVEPDLPLSEWAGQLAGAVSGIFLRRFPTLEMPSEEVAAFVDAFLNEPPGRISLCESEPGEETSVPHVPYNYADHEIAETLELEPVELFPAQGRETRMWAIEQVAGSTTSDLNELRREWVVGLAKFLCEYVDPGGESAVEQ